MNISTLFSKIQCEPGIVFPFLKNSSWKICFIMVSLFAINNSYAHHSDELQQAGLMITSVAPTCYKYCEDGLNPDAGDITYETDCVTSSNVSIVINGPLINGPANCPGTSYTFTYVATDDCGQTAMATRQFIIGNNGPTINCPQFNLVLECNDPNNDQYIQAHLDQVTANSSCGMAVTISNNFNGLNFTSCSNSSKVVIFTATDDCGRTTTCSTTITIQDNLAPVITTTPPSVCDEAECGGNVNYWFDHWIGYMLDGIVAEDDCDASLSISTIPSNPVLNLVCDESGDALTIVNFVVTDNCGNSSNIEGTFIVKNEFPGLFTNVPADETASCGGQPTFGTPDYESGCDEVITILDIVEDLGPCHKIYTRTWTATEACGNLSTSVSQSITVIDDEAPVFTITADDGSVDCLGDVAFGIVVATDNCTDVLIETEDVTNGDLCSGIVVRIWTATDECGNSATTSATINYADTEAPVFTITADDGSVDCLSDVAFGMVMAIDNCNDVLIETEDVTNGDLCSGVLIRTWTATDGCGNSATTSASMNYADTEAPLADTQPQDITVELGDPFAFDADPNWLDNCDQDLDISIIDNEEEGSCSSETIYTRTWIATDDCGNTTEITQTISVEDTTPPLFVDLPQGGDFECIMTFDIPDAVAEDLGGAVTITFEDEMTNTESTITLIRTWTATDLCGNSTTASATFTSSDAEDPIFTYVPPVMDLDCDDDLTFIEPIATDNCGDVVLTWIDDYSGTLCDAGYAWTRTWTATDAFGNTATVETVIWVDPDNEAPIFTYVPPVVDLDCDDDLTFEEPIATDNCGTVTLTWTEETNGTLCDAGYAWTRTWTATDACGNTASTETVIWVDPDNDAPEFTFVPNGNIISCNDFPPAFGEPEVYENCENFVLTHIDEYIGNSNGCTDAENFTYRRVWTATDGCGNNSTAEQAFLINASNAPSASIEGVVTTEMGETIEDVIVELDGASSGFVDWLQTGDDGQYLFGGLPVNNNYSITPALNAKPLNGITTYDLVLMSYHVLGIQNLDSPYKMIAADINRSGSITTLDLVALRKMILHINDDFNNNTSWRFVAADFVFPNATNPFMTAFPEMTNINGLIENEQHDFIGVKTGDVNESAIANSLVGGDDRSGRGDLYFDIADQQLNKDQTYEVSFKASDFIEIAGFQFAINFDVERLEWLEVKADYLTSIDENNFGFNLLDKGIITASWNNEIPVSLLDGAELFTLTFKAKTDVRLQQCIGFTSPLFAEVYSKDAEEGLLVRNLHLRYSDSSSQSDNLVLYQNRPNPFFDETTIGFYLPEPTTATLIVYDITGKILHQIEGNYTKGSHYIKLEADDLRGQGVLYYQLKTSERHLTKKMMLLKP